MGFIGMKSVIYITRREILLAYKNAKDYLPKELISEIQKYTDGTLLYIPSKHEGKTPWGQRSGTRSELEKRNGQITEDYYRGMSVCEISEKYYLSEDSIKKIIYKCARTRRA